MRASTSRSSRGPDGLKVVKLATLRTDSSGRFSLAVTPTVQTTYQAHFAGVQVSDGVTIGVRRRSRSTSSRTARLVAHVNASSSFNGKMVELQRRNGTNVADGREAAGAPNSTATFTLLVLPNSTVRVAMSVNQAGAGYLGTLSHPLKYRAV